MRPAFELDEKSPDPANCQLSLSARAGIQKRCYAGGQVEIWRM